MKVIKLYFQHESGSHKTGGHRSSNGWVTNWTEYSQYVLYTDQTQIMLSLKECSTIEDFLMQYENSVVEESDWGVYIEEKNINIFIIA